MRNILLAFALVLSGSGKNANAQTQWITETKFFRAIVNVPDVSQPTVVAQSGDRPGFVLGVEADRVDRLPLETAQKPTHMSASGNVVLTLPGGVRLTADSATIAFGSNVIALNNGSVRIELPTVPSSYKVFTPAPRQ
jgi:hypothetical protein